MDTSIQWILGVDEAGRGPLAGPVAVGVVCIPQSFSWEVLPGVNDSKVLSEGKREELCKKACQLRKEGALDYRVSMVGPQTIDRVGITAAVRLGIGRCMKKLGSDPLCSYVKLDGLLRAPEEYLFQETIVKGDAKEKVIGLASIVAKVTRDRYMCRLSMQYPEYGFAHHKGYGTRAHRKAIAEYGRIPIHRNTFLRVS